MWCVQFADSIGLPTDEGIFGFKPFPELWVGRLAMVRLPPCSLPSAVLQLTA